MALEPITRQEKIIADQDLTPITRMEKFLKQYGGGSGGVTSWNDLTDKPFGEVTTVKDVLAERQPEYTPDDGGRFYISTPPTENLTIGAKYIVTWNGVDYPATAYDMDRLGPFPHLINDSANMDTGEGWVFMISLSTSNMDGLYGAIWPLDGSTTLTISIRQEVTEVKKISGKYVEGMGYEEDGVVHHIDPRFLPSGGGGTKIYHDSYSSKTYTDEQLAIELVFSDAVKVELPVTIALYSQGSFTGAEVSVVAKMVQDTTAYFYYVVPTDESGGFEMLSVTVRDKSGPM